MQHRSREQNKAGTSKEQQGQYKQEINKSTAPHSKIERLTSHRTRTWQSTGLLLEQVPVITPVPKISKTTASQVPGQKQKRQCPTNTFPTGTIIGTSKSQPRQSSQSNKRNPKISVPDQQTVRLVPTGTSDRNTQQASQQKKKSIEGCIYPIGRGSQGVTEIGRYQAARLTAAVREFNKHHQQDSAGTKQHQNSTKHQDKEPRKTLGFRGSTGHRGKREKRDEIGKNLNT